MDKHFWAGRLVMFRGVTLSDPRDGRVYGLEQRNRRGALRRRVPGVPGRI